MEPHAGQTYGVARDDHTEEPAAKARPPLCRQQAQVLPVSAEASPHPAILPMSCSSWILDAHPGLGETPGTQLLQSHSTSPSCSSKLQREGLFGEVRGVPGPKSLLLCPACLPESSRCTG